MRRRQRHQHLFIGHTAIAPFGVAGQRQAGLAGLERPAPRIRASSLPDNTPLEFPVSCPLQPVDQNYHLTRRRVDQTYIGRVEPAAGERAHCQRLVFAEGDDIQCLLALACILGILVPDADVSLAGEPLLILRGEPDHRTALRADEIVRCDTDSPAQPRGHADDLVGGMDSGWTADFWDRRHLVRPREHLHSDHGGLRPKQAVQIGGYAGQVERFVLDCCMLHEPGLLNGGLTVVRASTLADCSLVATGASTRWWAPVATDRSCRWPGRPQGLSIRGWRCPCGPAPQAQRTKT